MLIHHLKDTIKKLFVLCFVVFCTISSCKHEPDKPIPVTKLVCFSEEVLPIFQTNCAKSGCHDATTAADGYVLNSYQNIISKGLDPFKPNNSKLYEVLVTTETDDRMPQFPAAPLSSAQIDLVYAWIAQGARNDVCSTGCDTANVTYSGAVTTVLNIHCMGCHRGASSSSGINLEGYANLKNWVDNGKLSKSVMQLPGAVAMPYQAAKMAECKVRTIQIWIDNGAPNN